MKKLTQIGLAGLISSCALIGPKSEDFAPPTQDLPVGLFAVDYSPKFVGNFFVQKEEYKALIGFQKHNNSKVDAYIRVFDKNASLDEVASFKNIRQTYWCSGVEDKGRFLGRCTGPDEILELVYDHALSWDLHEKDVSAK
tara:strand:- start:638 stop:1057 length:420 start_codon:yes stop_codon:yes gene_type:complete